MTLWAITELWNITHSNNQDFWDSFVLNNIVDRQGLIDYLLLEFGDMTVIDDYSDVFRHRVENFFIVHKWNIDKLAESLMFEYDPIGNTRWHGQDWHHTDNDETTDWKRNETINTDKVEDNDWTESGHTDETDTNYVSAFNDPESREGSIVDTEHHRDTVDLTYNKEGTNDTVTDIDVTENETFHQFVDANEDHSGTEDEWGHRNNHSFQQLIEEERKQAQFNIYKWIASHFCNELLVAVW